MHSRTMGIKEFDSTAAAEKDGFDIPLTKEQAGKLSEMNREQRRQGLKAQRKSGRTPGRRK